MKTTEFYFGFYQHMHSDNVVLSDLCSSPPNGFSAHKNQSNLKHFLHKTNKENKFHFGWAINQIKNQRFVKALQKHPVFSFHVFT